MLGWIIAGKAILSSAQVEKGLFLFFSNVFSRSARLMWKTLGICSMKISRINCSDWRMVHIQQGCHGNQIMPLTYKQEADDWEAKTYHKKVREDPKT